MHIAFDISQTGTGKAGCGYFADAMIKAMFELAPENRYTILPSFGDFYFDAMMPVRNPYSNKNAEYGPRHNTLEEARIFWEKTTVEASLGHPEVVHSNNFWCPVNLESSRLIYTFYDMGFIVDPEWTTEKNRIGCFNGVFRSAVSADWVIAISEASRSHYLSVFPHFPEDRIRVIFPCSRFDDSSAQGKKPKVLKNIPTGSFWLSVGTIEPRKNQRRLAQSYARYLAFGGSPMPLVFAGGNGWLMEDFKKYLTQLNIEAQIVMTGYVSDEELIWLYRNCYANLYPALFEGFGLPVLEGMQFGAPTLTSNTTSIPEISGDAAISIDPEDVEAWAQSMFRLAANRNEREHWSTVAIKQAAKFDWKKSAISLLDLYALAIKSPKRQLNTF